MIVYIGVPEEVAAQLKKDDVYRAPNKGELLQAATSLMALSELGIEGKVFYMGFAEGVLGGETRSPLVYVSAVSLFRKIDREVIDFLYEERA